MQASTNSLSPKYLWWKTPAEAAARPDLLIAQIMNLGTWEDVAALEMAVPAEQLRRVLAAAEPEQFSANSWHFWHLRLHVAEADFVPPLPARTYE
jgi:hypothetical protein